MNGAMARRTRKGRGGGARLAQALLDSLMAEVVLLDETGTIVAVNRAWREFDRDVPDERDDRFLGCNYLDVCDATHGDDRVYAQSIAESIRAILDGRSQAGQVEYPCACSDGLHWFLARMTPLRWDGPRRVVVSHEDITERKILEDLLAEQLALAHRLNDELEAANASLARSAAVDGLTGVGNRRAFDQALASAFVRSKRRGERLSLILVDLDHFKRLNDEFGHSAGDLALKAAAKALSDGARKADAVTRFGGEEFAVILPGAGLAEAVAVAQRLRQAVADLDGLARPITASFGVATVGPETASPEGLIAEADRALYQSKQDGRNRVTAG